MASYTFKASGVRKADHVLKTIERSFDADLADAAVKHVTDVLIPEIEAEFSSLEAGELAGAETIGVYDFRRKSWIMGNVPHEDRPVFAGYSRKQLEPAFQLVRNQEHWKNPIDTVVPSDADLPLLQAAVAFFTGSELVSEAVNNGYRVRADGYYIAIGA